MARRLYLGSKAKLSLFTTVYIIDVTYYPGLPTDTRPEDVAKFFEGYGRIIDCRVMTGSFSTNSTKSLSP